MHLGSPIRKRHLKQNCFSIWLYFVIKHTLPEANRYFTTIKLKNKQTLNSECISWCATRKTDVHGVCVCVSTSGFPLASSWSLVRRSSRVLVRMLSRSLPLLEPLSTWAFHSLYSSNGEQRRNLKRQRNAVKEHDLIHEIHILFIMYLFHLCFLVSSVFHASARATNIKLSPPDWKLYLEDRGERSLSRGAVIEDALVYPLHVFIFKYKTAMSHSWSTQAKVRRGFVRRCFSYLRCSTVWSNIPAFMIYM